MKALFLSNDPTIFDAASPTRARMRAYAAAIGEVHIVSRAPRAARQEQEGPLFLHPVHAPMPFAFFALGRAARRVIRNNGIQIVSAQDPFEHGFIARRAVRGTGARLHLQLHTDLASPQFARMSWKNRIRLLLADRTLPEADGIRTVSKRVKDGLIARYGERIVEPSVLPIVPQTAGASAVLPDAGFSFSLLMVGRLEPEKRVEDALTALRLVRAKYPGVGLYLAGSGSREKSLAKKARALGIGDAVIFLGPRVDAPGLMRSANALIQASAFEGYGRTFVEAAMARLPIVSTNVGIMGEVFFPEREALVSPAGDAAALAANVSRLIEDNQLRRALAVNAEAAALAHAARYANLPLLIADDLSHQSRPLRNSGSKG